MLTFQSEKCRLATLGVVLAVLTGCATVEPFSGESVDLAVEHMLHAIGEAAKISSTRSPASSELELSQISVELETVAVRTTSGEFTLSVVTFDGSREQDLTQAVTVLLKPSKVDPKSATMTEEEITSPHPEMVKGLAKGFDAAYLAARGARAGLQRVHSGDTPLETSDITVEINFTVTGSASASPTVTILGISLTGSHTRERKNVHQIKMVFKEKSTADDSST